MCNPFKQAETKEIRKHQELVNTPNSLFNVQDIWETEEARNFCVYKRVITIHSGRKKNNGLRFVTPFLCPF